ncbi:MAG: hypothetical protein J6Y32_07115 [Bacteroidales bacterium]|nr:hypothetical protein [Bacteroidales bacterium]
MSTWLFTWNPTRYPWNDRLTGYLTLKNQISQVGSAFHTWSCGVNKSIITGDRIFLIRLGEEPRGIIASGYAATGVFESPHWNPERARNGERSKRIYIEFDKILDVEKEKILPLSELKHIASDYCWSPQSSGINIPSHIAEEIEKHWIKL